MNGVTIAGGEAIGADAVVVAAGPWTEELPLPAPIPFRPVKGQILRLHDPAGPGLLTRVVRMGPSYVVPRGDGRYVIGATSEERGFDTTVTAGGVFELLRDASELIPGVSEFVLDECAAGLRPGTSDNLPVLGPADIPGLHWAAGLGRGGILLAPITAELVCAGLGGAGSAAAGLDPSPVRGPALRSDRRWEPGVNVTVNGEDRRLGPGATVASVLALLDVTPGARGVAVALDGEVVSRSLWDETAISEGALIEVVAAIQGG